MGFSRLDYWSGLPFSSPEGLPNPGSNPHLLHWQVDLYHWTTREARVLGRPWGMLSASFNMVEAFSQSFSLFLCLSLFLHTHTHTHTHTVSHDTSTLENVLIQWPLCLAFLGHKDHCTDLCSFGLICMVCFLASEFLISFMNSYSFQDTMETSLVILFSFIAVQRSYQKF